MLILDKQRAIERIVALTELRGEGHLADESPIASHAQVTHRVATYTPRPAVAPVPIQRTPSRRRALPGAPFPV